MTTIPREMLEAALQFMHIDKLYADFPGMSDDLCAALFGIDVATYRDIKATFVARTHQAAQELLADAAFAAAFDRIPFAAGGTVVGVGSSTTDDSQSWLEILRACFELRRPQDGIKFVNAGVSGDTTVHMITRFAEVVAQQPDWIICYISANDGRRHGPEPTKCLVSPGETEKNLAALRHYAAVQTSARWLWMTPTVVIEERIADYAALSDGQVMYRNADLATIADQVLKQPEPAVNLFELFGQPAAPHLILPDGLHPSLEGHKLILTALVKTLGTLSTS